MDFSEKQMISHATIRGLCNRAEGEKAVTRKGDQVSWWERGESLGSCRAEGEHVSVATGKVPPEKRGPLVSWTYCEEDANDLQDLVACLLLHGCLLGMGRGEAGQGVAVSPQR